MTYQQQLNALIRKVMSRSEAASVAGKASAAARRKRAGNNQSPDAKSATQKAKALLAARGPAVKGKASKGKGKKSPAVKKPIDPAKAKEKADREKAKAERVEAAKVKAAERQKVAAEKAQARKEKVEARLKSKIASGSLLGGKAKDASGGGGGGSGKKEKEAKEAEKKKAAEKADAERAAKKESAEKVRAEAAAKRTEAKATQEKAKQAKETKLNTAAATRVSAALAAGGPRAQISSSDSNRLIAGGFAVETPDRGLVLTEEGKALLDSPGGSVQKSAQASLIWSGWAEISKIDEEQRIVWGIASTDAPDNEPGIWKNEVYAGDIIDPEAIRKAAPDYLQFPTIREMHQPIAAGTAVHFEVRDGKTYIGAHIVDDQAWQKVINKVYRGFSIGGKCLDASIIKIQGRPFRKVTELNLVEISLVDRPRNPDAKITLYKGENILEDELTAGSEANVIEKAAVDPAKAIAMLQSLRNEAETAGDLDAADGYTAAIRQVAQAAGLATPSESEDEDGDLADDLAATEAGDEEPIEMSATVADLRKKYASISDNDFLDLLKAGAVLSASNLGLAQQAHDAIAKMTGGAVCAPPAQQADGLQMGRMLAPDDFAKAVLPAFEGITKLLEHNGLRVDAIAKRIEALEAQPAPGSPAVRAVPLEKVLVTGESTGDTIQKSERQIQLDVLKAQREQATDPTVLRFLGDQITKLTIAENYSRRP